MSYFFILHCVDESRASNVIGGCLTFMGPIITLYVCCLVTDDQKSLLALYHIHVHVYSNRGFIWFSNSLSTARNIWSRFQKVKIFYLACFSLGTTRKKRWHHGCVTLALIVLVIWYQSRRLSHHPRRQACYFTETQYKTLLIALSGVWYPRWAELRGITFLSSTHKTRGCSLNLHASALLSYLGWKDGVLCLQNSGNSLPYVMVLQNTGTTRRYGKSR